MSHDTLPATASTTTVDPEHPERGRGGYLPSRENLPTIPNTPEQVRTVEVTLAVRTGSQPQERAGKEIGVPWQGYALVGVGPSGRLVA